ncbi:MAG: thioredoxin domain-containing protein [Kineosporiaceae bacterium]|nr:thioredoxin domain-containing protein [Aeromicrobium sp.]
MGRRVHRHEKAVNRLGSATSPYLLQHADNPVEWYEWGAEALAAAADQDKPILLSVGYAACHWCHVMGHESFEDEGTAAFMNAHFINIKVDREERPDIDAVYMSATQAMTGQGGWPMTCALTPVGKPFFAGTYFPAEPRQNMPSFSQVIQSLADAWENRRDEVEKVGAEVVEHLSSEAVGEGVALDAEALDLAAHALSGQYDTDAGGFGASPKFPPSMILEFLLRHAHRTGSTDSIAMVGHTCDAMARGGLYDQLAGGFSRYSVDRFWRVPHFEKMLYDNAQLLRVYLHLWRQDGDPLARRIAHETAQFLLAELRTGEGGFASALDADSDGHEGTYYAWYPEQLREVLGVEDGDWAAELLAVTTAGTFERGLSTLQLRNDPDDLARWERIRAALREARNARTYPARDDKIVAAWNGLAISGLAEAGVLLGEPELIAAAVRAAELLATLHTTAEGRLIRTSREGKASANAGVLEDYGCVAESYIAVLGVTGDAVWLDRARVLLDQVIDHFVDPAGGFFDTSSDAESLVMRPKDVSDNASPSGASAVTAAFVAFAAVTGESAYLAAAETGLASAAALARQVPRFAGWSLASAESLQSGPLEVAIVGPADQRGELHRAALHGAGGGAVVIAGDEGLDIPLFEQRGLLDGKPAAYLCKNFVCQRPVTDPQELFASGPVLSDQPGED